MRPNGTFKRKLSERIAAVGAEFINVGTTLEDKHDRLTAVCSAWNIANGSRDKQQYQLDQYFESTRKLRPQSAPEDLALMRRDMELLIERKLKLFKDDDRKIISAKVVPATTGYRIEVASTVL
jgi:hypothetical protein